MKLKTKLLVLYFSFAIIPVIVVYFFSLEIYSRNVSAIEEGLLDYAVTQTSRNLSERVRQYKHILAQVSTDRILISHIADFCALPPTDNNRAMLFRHIVEIFDHYMRTDNNIASIILVTNQLDIVWSQRTGEELWEFMLRVGDPYFRKAFLDLAYDSDGINIIQTASFPGAVDYVNQFVYFTFPAMDLISRNVYGVFIMELSSTVFNQVIGVGNNPTILDSYVSSLSCITNELGTIIASLQETNVGLSLYDLEISSGMIIRSSPIFGTDLTVNLVFERSAMQVFTDNFRNMVLVFVLSVMFVFSLVILFFIDRLSVHSNKIVQAIRQFSKTQQATTMDINKNDEFLFAIADQFNQMSMEVERLVNELKTKNEHIKIAKDQQLRAELQAVEAQINPHFIYNALDRINWIAIDNGQDQISKMLNGLASLLRYSICNIDMLVPLKAEIEWMNKYIYIQGERFGHEIKFASYLDDGTADFYIHKMLLQPLVENSILHGFEGHKVQAEINLFAQICYDGMLEITIEDNGLGIKDSILKQIRTVLIAHGKSDSSHIGISNVASRIWYYYGERATIEVYSQVGEGTCFKLLIPGV